MTLAQLIKEARENKGWTQASLASKLQVTAGIVSNWENGHAKPSGFIVERLNRVLGIKLDDAVAEESSGEIEEFQDVDLTNLKDVRGVPGVYLLWSHDRKRVYIGRTGNSIEGRINQHKKKPWFGENRVDLANYVQIYDEYNRRRLERILIKTLKICGLAINKQV